MRIQWHRLLAFLLALVLSASLLTFTAPSASAAYVYNPQPSGWNVFSSAVNDKIKLFTGVDVMSHLDGLLLTYEGQVTPAQLNQAMLDYNKWWRDLFRSTASLGGLLGNYEVGSAAITWDKNNDIYRLVDNSTNEYITDSHGRFPYYLGDGDVPENPGASTPAPPSISRNRFVDVRALKSPYNVISYNALSEAVKEIGNDGYPCTIRKLNDTHYGIVLNSTLNGYFAFYANGDGQPFVAAGEKTVTDVDFDYIVNNNDNSITVDNSQIIDINDNTFTLIDDNGQKITLNIDSLLYDASNKSYTLNTYQTNIVNEGDNYYYTYNYYTYSVTYNITNTYITYIGANEAYDKKEYEYYYELPDGRSSADLTAEDVAGLSFQFHDVVNYAKSATDVSVRALYHFDGDTSDSSYFSTQGKFDWTNGASITYMDSGVFEGALYLDSNAHSFDITLPSNLGSGDFTLQFRHYQASQPDTLSNIENSINVGAVNLLKWDEQKFYSPSGSAIASMPVGSWSEIALVRHSGKLYTYLNGLCVSTASNTAILSDTITFSLGSTSRANTMLDELRVVNFAVAESGKAYTPTSVPFDSNLVLVLPDSAHPVADEYLEITSSGTNLLGYHFNSFTSGTIPTNLTTVTMPTALGTKGGYTYFPQFFVANGYSTLTAHDDFLRLTRINASDYAFVSPYGPSYNYHYCAGLTSCFGIQNTNTLKANTDYVFSVVLADGRVCSLPFKSWMNMGSGNNVSWGTPFSSRSFDWGTISIGPRADREKNDSAEYYYGLSIVPNSAVGSFVDIAYMELVEGTSTDLSTEWISCVYPEEDVQPNTAAIQTDIPVNGYTVGGVRPTFPKRGQVWFPVSGSRIAGCYVYTGSMWEEVGCRYYTGSRWIPIYAFDIVTLEDCFDVADAENVNVPITTESGFWNWWKSQWLDFRAWLEGVLSGGSGSGGSGGSGSEDTRSFWDKVADALTSGLATLIEGLFGLITTVLQSLLGLVTDALSFVFGFLTDTVLGGIKDFFASFGGGTLFEGFQPNEEGEGATLPEGVPAVFAFFSGVVMALPPEIRGILIFGIAALFLFGVFKLIKS